MTATVNAPRHAPSPASARQSSLAGMWTLLRFMLRRDRIRTSAWVLAVGLSGFMFATAMTSVYETQEDIEGIATMLGDPVMRMLVGPIFGMDAPTHERVFSAAYVLFIYIPIALFSIFTVVRHTRAEEQSRRAELIRANVVGRHATLTATVLLTTAANLIIAALLYVGVLAAEFGSEGSALIAAGGFVLGMFFTGVAAVTVQLSQSARAASAMAGAVLGLAYLVRMGGDMAEEGGSALSWFSPLAWSQQTAPFVEDRWWPLLISAGFAAVLIWLGFFLSTKRDVEASMFSTRLGRAEAKPSLGTPVGMAGRTLWGGLRGWGVALILTGLMFGSFAQAMMDAADDLPAEMAQMFSGDDIMLGYLAFMGVFIAIFAGAAGVSGLQQLRGEEHQGRAEYAMSAPIGRTTWLGSHLTVLMIGVAVILALAGLGMGLGAAVSLDEDGGEYIGQLLLATVLQIAPVLAIIGIVTTLFGWIPRLANAVGWLLIGFSGFVTTFSGMLDLPDGLIQLSVFSHLAEYPVEDIEWAPVLWLSVIGIIGLVLGLIGWNRREVNRV
ncbi:ABC transporter permease [Nesterenkonia muleiensis]|uniref:ABC transporter permease n=1 Tax=Nesterenkonia muleiensis TaxID=2282648 RepID=UPI000E7600B5|nr:hypothetical protein [Nesterenkonia muleiensis]